MPSQPKPTFGRPLLAEWALDPGVTYLNHGTVGAPPRRILALQQALRDEIERQPSRFLLRELAEVRSGAPRSEPPRMRVAAEAVGRFFGVRRVVDARQVDVLSTHQRSGAGVEGLHPARQARRIRTS